MLLIPPELEPCLETDAHTQELHLRRTFVLNKDRLARQVVSLGPTYRDMVHLLKGKAEQDVDPISKYYLIQSLYYPDI
jgi:hypothetical protein